MKRLDLAHAGIPGLGLAAFKGCRQASPGTGLLILAKLCEVSVLHSSSRAALSSPESPIPLN